MSLARMFTGDAKHAYQRAKARVKAWRPETGY
jgi:hypothetical protein